MENLKDPGNLHKLALKLYFNKRTYRKNVTRSKRNYERKLNQDIELGKIIDWKKFSRLKKFREPLSPLGLDDLMAFENFFKKLYDKNSEPPNHPSSTIASLTVNSASKKFEGINRNIEVEEVKAAIKSLKPGKSCSLDLVSNEFIKCLPHEGIKALTRLFNLCLSDGCYPWNSSVIVPLHKSGDKHNPDNYRAIGISSCLGKTFSTVLLYRLLKFRSEFCPDPPNQLGFCKEAQTNDHIFTLKTIVDKYRSNNKMKNKRLFACFIDFKKAFDNVSRDLLLYKLSKFGIHGNFFNVMEDMYNKSTARLKIGKFLSRVFHVRKGTEQGHPMSPDLFKLFILDLSQQLSLLGSYPVLNDSIVNHLLWADDLVLFGLDQESLQKNLDILNTFCSTWGLEVNIKKTKVVCFGRRPSNYTFKLNSIIIDYVDSYTYLGVTITKNGHFTTARADLRKKALRALFALKKHASREYHTPRSLLFLFDSLIKPILAIQLSSTITAYPTVYQTFEQRSGSFQPPSSHGPRHP